MDIHINEVLDFVQCPMLHKLRYIDKLDVTYTGLHKAYPKVNEQSLEEAFDREIHRLMYHIFNMIQDGRYPSEYLLRQKWGSYWTKNKSKQDIMFEATRKDGMNAQRKLEKAGVKVIETIHPKFKQTPGIPIFVGKNTNLKIGHHNITVPLELVRELKDEKGKPFIEIMDFKTGIKTKGRLDHKPLNLHILHDLQTTAASLAFRQLTGIEEGQITYYDIVNDREYVTSRGENDYETLEHVLNHVEQAMNHKIYYPVMNDRCFECPYQHICRRRDWYEKEPKEE